MPGIKMYIKLQYRTGSHHSSSCGSYCEILWNIIHLNIAW